MTLSVLINIEVDLLKYGYVNRNQEFSTIGIIKQTYMDLMMSFVSITNETIFKKEQKLMYPGTQSSFPRSIIANTSAFLVIYHPHTEIKHNFENN